MRNRFAEAEDELVDQLNAGQIDQKTFDKAMRDLHEEERENARDAAEYAYDMEMNR